MQFVFQQNFAAQMAGGFDEKAGGAQMGVMQGPMVRELMRYVVRSLAPLDQFSPISFRVVSFRRHKANARMPCLV